jgi:hypothetical protein
MTRNDIPRWLLLAVLFVAVAVLMVTHLGAHSPYTYVCAMFKLPPIRQYGMLVNPDARFLLPVTQFFYEPRLVDYSRAYNLKLPMQSFLAAIGMSFTHSYLLGTLVMNLLAACIFIAAAVNLAGKCGLSRRAMLVAGLTFLSLPLWAHYIGQPMQYTVVTSINFLILLIAFELARTGAATPLNFGILTALLMLNYDWYVFAAALFLYLLLTGALRNARQVAVYLVTAIAPLFLWLGFLRGITGGLASGEIRNKFIEPVMGAWVAAFEDLRIQPLTPYVTTSIGIRIGLTEVMALLYWPLIVACVIALLYAPRDGDDRQIARLIALIVIVFAVEQTFTAGFEWENNPRRAIPVVLAFGAAYAVAVDRTMHRRAWRVVWMLLLVMTLALTYADRLFSAPAITFFDSGEATRGLPKEALAANNRMLDKSDMPLLDEDRNVQWSMPGRAVVRERSQWFAFIGTQLGALAMVCGVLLMAARARLLPRWSAPALVAVWALSLVTRWI